MTNDAAPRRRTLVTGTTGFIGSRLVPSLVADGWEVHVVVREGSNPGPLAAPGSQVVVHAHDGSTRGMMDLVAKARPEVVFHLASRFLAQHVADDVEDLIASNLLFSTQLVEAMVENDVKHLVNTGTSWQHFHDAAYEPVNLYAATKQAFEDILAYYVSARGLKVITLALFDTYGPGDPRAKLISLLWKTVNAEQPILMSPGEQLIDLVFIDDVVAAFKLAAERITTNDIGHARYGISSGNPIPLRDLVAEFEAATGHRLPITWGGRPYRPREVMTPWHSFQPLPGWHPRVPFAVGIVKSRPTDFPGA